MKTMKKTAFRGDYIFLFSYFLESMFSLLLQNQNYDPLIVGRSKTMILFKIKTMILFFKAHRNAGRTQNCFFKKTMIVLLLQLLKYTKL